MIKTDDIFLRAKELPYGMRGLTVLDAEGDYNIYVNARLSDSSRRRALIHELRHIVHGDFRNNLPIAQAEGLCRADAP